MKLAKARKLMSGCRITAPRVGIREATVLALEEVPDDPRVLLLVHLNGHKDPINYKLVELASCNEKA